MGCFAEVASQFRHAGGPYLYTRVAFGRLPALEVAWLLWLSRLTAAAAAINLFARIWAISGHSAQRPLERALLAAAILFVITGVNLLGVKVGAHLSSAFTSPRLRRCCFSPPPVCSMASLIRPSRPRISMWRPQPIGLTRRWCYLCLWRL